MKRILILLYCLLPILLYGQSTLSALDNMHQVARGETWEIIAYDHGVSVAELQAANPDVFGKKLKKGSWLIIPKASQPANSQDSLPSSSSPKPTPTLSPARTSIPNLKVGILLPFADGKMVEFYRGLLMAADSIRKDAKVNLDIHAWDCGTSVSQIEALLPQLSGLDIIFGPASSSQMPIVAENCREQGTRLVLPFWNGQASLDYPLVYSATAPIGAFFDTAVKKMLSFFSNKNYVIVHTGNSDDRAATLCETLSKELSLRSVLPRKLELEGDEFAYETAFNQFRENMIVLDDSNIRSLNILLSHLKDFRQKHPEYRLSLIGFPEWQNETQWLLPDLYAFDSYIISPYYYNVLDERTRSFQRAYEKCFHTPIGHNNPRQAAYGFDLGCYFLGGISSLGDTFEQNQGNVPQEPYQSPFRFERSATGMSFTNRFVQFIHYTPEGSIELIR